MMHLYAHFSIPQVLLKTDRDYKDSLDDIDTIREAAFYYHAVEQDLVTADIAYTRALKVLPNDAEVLNLYAFSLRCNYQANMILSSFIMDTQCSVI